MDGIHDLGGKEGFGAVVREADEPVFHARWESRVFGLNLVGAGGAARNRDHFRHAIERIDPVAYLTHGYYGRWLGGVETMIVEAGILDTAAITGRALELGASPDDRIASQPSSKPDHVDYEPLEPGNRRLVTAPARFRTGDRVRTCDRGTRGHTRLPGYARGRRGIVVAMHDGWVYPDTNAHGRGENPQHLYTVAFEGVELWGPEAESRVVVHLDLFEPYLERSDG
ncbi:MAG TPA: nitrile hydratase subunit beta [Pseudomonadales bacterium]|nr:nitrile hydratase subunit beta [Pseudomonadales bacterium]